MMQPLHAINPVCVANRLYVCKEWLAEAATPGSMFSLGEMGADA